MEDDKHQLTKPGPEYYIIVVHVCPSLIHPYPSTPGWNQFVSEIYASFLSFPFFFSFYLFYFFNGCIHSICLIRQSSSLRRSRKQDHDFNRVIHMFNIIIHSNQQLDVEKSARKKETRCTSILLLQSPEKTNILQQEWGWGKQVSCMPYYKMYVKN